MITVHHSSWQDWHPGMCFSQSGAQDRQVGGPAHQEPKQVGGRHLAAEDKVEKKREKSQSITAASGAFRVTN